MPSSKPTPTPHEERILIVVRTYPTPSQKDIEVSCTAGVTSSGKFIRIFPVPFRYMEGSKRFRKYEEIKASIWRSDDSRPESFKIDPDSINVIEPSLGTENFWSPRWQRVEHIADCCMCCLQRQQEVDGPLVQTLGFIQPAEIEELVLEDTSATWSDLELRKLSQGSLWHPDQVKLLEKIPYRFRYRYRCPHGDCKTHLQMCTDWEMSQSFRSWRDRYGGDWEQAFRNKYEYEMIDLNDTRFYVGTVNRHPKSWIVVGLWYPRKVDVGSGRQLPLL